jgi:hypothetical protein
MSQRKKLQKRRTVPAQEKESGTSSLLVAEGQPMQPFLHVRFQGARSRGVADEVSIDKQGATIIAVKVKSMEPGMQDIQEIRALEDDVAATARNSMERAAFVDLQ